MIQQKAPTKNGILKTATCPVCQTKQECNVAHCQTCAWSFPLAGTPQYALELSRAKQQFQMMSSFNQLLQGMQTQTKALEKISFRLDGMENEINALKIKQPVVRSILHKYDYPDLLPIQKVADFDTEGKRTTWWNSLEEQWKKAFNQSILRKENDYPPTDEEIKYILESPTLRVVGASAMHPSIDFELTNLSGVQHLTDLTLLVASHNALVDLAGIEHLEKLETLFVNANKLTNLKEVHYLPQLKKLYCNANQLSDLHPLEPLTNLELLNCGYNCLVAFEGITAKHVDKLRDFRCMPNEAVPKSEIERMNHLEIDCKKS